MTREQNARVAGFTFLFYIVAGICGLAAFNVATRGSTIAAQLASVGARSLPMTLSFTCLLVAILCALILAVTLYRLTREQDVDLARLAMSCRFIEAAINAVPAIALLALIRVATKGESALPEESTRSAIAGLLLGVESLCTPVAATMFAIGSAIYCALLLRGRLAPASLMRLGLIASILLIVIEPLAAVGIIKSFFAAIVWLPMLAFEVPFGIWLLRTGAEMRRSQ
jgi:hypothetical protein